MSFTYTKELELLILDVLLPKYIRYYKEKGLKVPENEINSKLLKQIKQRKRLPALLRPQEKQT